MTNELHNYIVAFNAKFSELEKFGYYSNGYHFDTKKTVICKDGHIAGYMHRNLNIEWLQGQIDPLFNG